MRRLVLASLICGLFAAVPAATSASPPSPPPACGIVPGTAAFATGSEQGLTMKEATYSRLCPIG